MRADVNPEWTLLAEVKPDAATGCDDALFNALLAGAKPDDGAEAAASPVGLARGALAVAVGAASTVLKANCLTSSASSSVP